MDYFRHFTSLLPLSRKELSSASPHSSFWYIVTKAIMPSTPLGMSFGLMRVTLIRYVGLVVVPWNCVYWGLGGERMKEYRRATRRGTPSPSSM